MEAYIGYIRVSTVKQGETGVSLQAQREAIEAYAKRHDLSIKDWFEETETAAKTGRPIFTQMIRLLKAGKAEGVIMHKIDRSARNLRDWASLGDLIDQGVGVHFANESVDLQSRGGRLSADIQAVVAADYIRNLKEEAKKGFYGRLKQGILPLAAPLGYRDMGGGKPKEPHPVMAPLVRKAFELYATGTYNLERLENEMFLLGLRNRKGGKVTIKRFSYMLNNPFYIGLIRLKGTGEVFQGAHQPLISKSMFDRVKAVLRGKVNARTQRHDFLFRRLIKCKHCFYSLVGEPHKGHIYYRCQTKSCQTTCFREETIEGKMLELLSKLEFSEDERLYLQSRIPQLQSQWKAERETQTTAIELNLRNLQDRLNRLTDAYIDRLIEREVFEGRKAGLLMEEKALQEKHEQLTSETQSGLHGLLEFLELAGSAYSRYRDGFSEEKRDLVKILTLNLTADGKNIEIAMKSPLQDIANRFAETKCAPQRRIPRTWDQLLAHVMEQYAINKDIYLDKHMAA